MQARALQTALGRTMRAARERLNLSRATLGEMTGLDENVLGAIEQGRIMPLLPAVRALASSLKLSADELLGLERPEVPLVGATPEAVEHMKQLFALIRRWPPARLATLVRLAVALEDSPPEKEGR